MWGGEGKQKTELDAHHLQVEANSHMEKLLKRGSELVPTTPGQELLSASEAERGVEGLQKLSVEEVGSSKWMDQREWIDKLNIQAHYNAQNHMDEFVVEFLVSHNKVATLMHELLVMEAWRDKVFPHLKEFLAKKVDTVTSYYVIYHEVTLANLLEVSCFDTQAFEDLSEDLLLELCDWCGRKLQYLNTDGHRQSTTRDQELKDLLNMSGSDELERKCWEVDFATAISSLTVLRYLCENINKMPICIMSRLLRSIDVVMSLVALIRDPPWVRNRKGKIEKYIDNVWRVCLPKDHLRVNQLDGQVWLSLCILLMEPKCREMYSLDEFRKEKILNLRRHFNEVLFDQLPVLKELDTNLDQMILGIGPGYTQVSNGLIIEQVPMYRVSMLQNRDWEAVATNQMYTSFGEESEKQWSTRMNEMLKCINFMCEMHPDEVGSTVDEVENRHASIVSLEARRQVKNTTVWERVADYSFEIDVGSPAEPVDLSTTSAKIKGLRYKLKRQDMNDNDPFPANGKVVVRHNGKCAEAFAKLPAPPTKASSRDAPGTVWLTAGLLAKDKFALQIKLKKSDRNLERSRMEGVWNVYHPVGGAITIAET